MAGFRADAGSSFASALLNGFSEATADSGRGQWPAATPSRPRGALVIGEVIKASHRRKYETKIAGLKKAVRFIAAKSSRMPPLGT